MTSHVIFMCEIDGVPLFKLRSVSQPERKQSLQTMLIFVLLSIMSCIHRLLLLYSGALCLFSKQSVALFPMPF